MSKTQLNEWKDMLVTIFRAKDRRKMMAGYQQHMHMARLSDEIWTKVLRATEKVTAINEKFFRPLMRIDDDEKIKECLNILMEDGTKVFHKKVKQFIDEGCVKSKKTKQTEQPNVETPNEREDSIVLKRKYLTLKEKHSSLLHEFEQIAEENKRLKEELENIKAAAESKGKKRVRDSDDANEFHVGEKIEAFWKDADGESWLLAKVVRLNKNGARVQYEVDSGIANVPFSWLRKVSK
ncbi:uncharacterized protein LOC132760637 [Ruditapes philippinarum]|uniref:uncharacterized protein LOC132760637 n=1 Tax=Ruditapes philippinarum TaxID=129788 RepID=UPI00295B0D33|nr:uncharacterized protein LOC132760637 [Ruditapes philippinarum]